MRRVWAIGLVAVVLLAAGGVKADPVRIGFAAESLDYAPAFAAERLGLFKQHGVEVKLIVFRGGAAAQEAMSAGATDIIAYFAPGGGAGETARASGKRWSARSAPATSAGT